MADIQVFQNDNFGTLRTVEIDGEYWFVATDICKALSLTNPTKAVKDLDDDERSNFKLGRQGFANIINEPGLYSLIMRSKKPEAKKFKRWVTHDVLPTLRTTGEFSLIDNEPTVPQRILNSDDYLAAARLIATCKNDRLPIVLHLLAKGGWDIAEAKRSIPEKISTADAMYLLGEATKAGLTSADLEKMTGIPSGTIRMYRSGRRFPTPARYAALCTAINDYLENLEMKETEEINEDGGEE